MKAQTDEEPTQAQRLVASELGRFLDSSIFRVGALLVTAPPISGRKIDGKEPSTRIVSCCLMKEATIEAAVDLSQLIHALRDMACDIEAQMAAAKEADDDRTG